MGAVIPHKVDKKWCHMMAGMMLECVCISKLSVRLSVIDLPQLTMQCCHRVSCMIAAAHDDDSKCRARPAKS